MPTPGWDPAPWGVDIVDDIGRSASHNLTFYPTGPDKQCDKGFVHLNGYSVKKRTVELFCEVVFG
jgi:hypothetical protein